MIEPEGEYCQEAEVKGKNSNGNRSRDNQSAAAAKLKVAECADNIGVSASAIGRTEEWPTAEHRTVC